MWGLLEQSQLIDEDVPFKGIAPISSQKSWQNVTQMVAKLMVKSQQEAARSANTLAPRDILSSID
jgi:hypothetical protein